MKNYLKIVFALILTLFAFNAHADLNVYEEMSVMEVTDLYSRKGTAFAIGKNRLVTAYHVLEGQTNQLYVVYYGRPYPVKVVAISPNYDFAILSAPTAKFSNPLKVAKSTSIGSSVRIYGYPSGSGFSKSDGQVISLTEEIRHWWGNRPGGRATAKVRGGYSGGPVVDRNTNQVVGVLTNHELPNPLELLMGTSDFDGLFTRCDQLHMKHPGAF